MNYKFLDKSKVLVNLNKSLADELTQLTSFPTARSNKKNRKPNKAGKPKKKPSGFGFFKNPGFF